MKITAQGFLSSSDMPFRKATVSLWPTNVAASGRFSLGETNAVFMDAPNFYDWERGNPAVVHAPFETGSTGYGAMYFTNFGGGSTRPKLHYPIVSDRGRRYDVYIRYKTSASTLDINLFVDGSQVQTLSETVVPGSWATLATEVVIPDRTDRVFSLSCLTTDTYIDYICFVPTGPEPALNYDQYPYITLHAGVHELSANEPQNLGPFYDAKSTFEEIQLDDQYNFDMQRFAGASVNYNLSYAFSLYPVGSTDTSYIVWDLASEGLDPYFALESYTNDSGSVWIASDSRFALTMWFFVDALDENACNIQTPPAEAFIDRTNKFDDPATEPVFVNTTIQNDNGTTNEVALELPDRIVSILMDQSGSMTWNDEPKTRHDIVRRLITRLDSTYPGTVNFNLFSFESTPIRVNFFAVVEDNQTDTNDSGAIADSFFADQESGYAGCRVVRRDAVFPANAIDGDIVTEGFLDRSFDDNLVENEDYFYSIFTFDKFGTFSNGNQIEVTPRPRILPNGVGAFTSRILRGTGVRLDEHVKHLWHFDEGSGLEAFDFTSNQAHLTYNPETEPLWLNESDVPIGISGIRQSNANGNFFSGNIGQGSSVIFDNTFTIMMWVLPFQDAANPAAFLYYEVPSGGGSGFTIAMSGQDLFTFNGGGFAGGTVSAPIVYNEWNHIAVTGDLVSNQTRIYVNGVEAGNGAFSNTDANILADQISIGGNGASPSNSLSLFGKITEVSTHTVVRDLSYIQQAYSEGLSTSSEAVDNGDRVLAFSYTVPSDYNYVGGTVRVIEKEEAGPRLRDRIDNPDTGDFTFEDIGFGDIPYHENDGVLVYEESASPGTVSFTISQDFIHGREYHYKIFSRNAIGNYSLWSDSPVLSITIPEFDTFEQRSTITGGGPNLPTVDGLASQPGNRKNYVTWTIPGLTTDVKEVKVFYSDTNFPIVDENGESDTDLVFRGNPDQTGFVHRNIENNIEAFYTVVTTDQYGNTSDSAFVSSTPLEDADEIGIPLLEVRKLRYEIVTDNAISLAWQQPVLFQKQIDGWFDQRIALFAQITDEFGAPVADDSNLQFTASGDTSGAGNSEDVFGDQVNRDTTIPTFEESHILTTSQQGNGVLRGILRMVDDFNILSALNSISFSVFVQFAIPDRDNPSSNIFEFNSKPISISLRNPFDMTLVNLNNDKVEHLCKSTVNLSDVLTQSTGGLLVSDRTKNFDGTYVRRQEPFVARVRVTYRDEAITDGGNVFVAVHEASDPDCDDTSSNPTVKFEPGFSDRKSRTVLPPATTLPLLIGVEGEGSEQSQFSYADVPLDVPRDPQGVMFFAKASYNGFFGRRKLYIAFENILRIDLTAEPPAPDCVDVAEQFCSAYMIDPDNPTRRIRVPDNEVVRWKLRKGISGKDRPFYSTDNVVNNGPGVFSRVAGGTARKVFFGPACGVTWFIVQSQFGPQLLPELYAVRVDIVYDGLSAFDEKPTFIFPQQTTGGFGSRLLMHLNQYLVEMWADGYDYEKLTIWKDPNQAGGLFGNVFINCSNEFNGTIFVLNTGQPVEVETGNSFEILYGPDLEIGFDPYIDEPMFSNNEEEIGFATINLEETPSTEAYLRINSFIGPPQRNSGGDNDPVENNCSAIDFRYRQGQADSVISGRTETELDGDIRYLTGGGGAENGIPPCIVRLREPLDIRIVQIRRDNEVVNDLLVDGQTSHVFIVRAQFAGRPVPDGTPIRLTVGGNNPTKIQVPEQVIFTETVIDPLIDEQEAYSLAAFTLLPMSPIQEFEAQIQAEINYDKRGDIERSMTACVTINYEVQEEEPDEEEGEDPEVLINNLYNGSVDVYDTVADSWETLPNDLNHPRGALTLTWTFDPYGEVLYAIGGIDGNRVTRFNEQYRIDSQTWTDMAEMQTARFYHQAIEDAGDIYVFGGFTISNAALEITRNCERYDASRDAFLPFANMPRLNENDFESYGVALGSAVKVGSKVYILCGIRLIDGSGGIEEYNDRILTYDLDTDIWETSDILSDADLILYQRVSPFAYYDEDDNSIRVIGGSLTEGSGQDQAVTFLTDSFKIDLTDLSLSSDEQEYSLPPRPRFKGQTAVVGNSAYFLGGETRKAKVSRVFETVDTTEGILALTELSEPLIARQAFGMTSDDFRYIYIAGGITSGRPPGFLQIEATATPKELRLDGKQSAGIEIKLTDDVGEQPSEDIRILVRGFVLLADNSDNKNADDLSGGGGGSDDDQQSAADNIARSALIYPVVFSSNDITAVNGFASTTLLPRSEDILDKVDEIQKKLELARRGEDTESAEETEPLIINEGDIRQPYQIRVQITVLDDFYYGQTVVDFTDNEDPEQFADTGGDEDPDNNDDTNNDGQPDVLEPPPTDPYSPQFEGCRGFEVTTELPDEIDNTTNENNVTENDDDRISDDLKDRDNPIFDLNPPQSPQLESPTVSYFSDIEWIPQVIPYINSNVGTAEEALDIVERLRNAVPFGASPFYDGLGEIANVMLGEELDTASKVIYVQTDNEESLSFISLDTALENVQAVDGFAEVPVLVNNFSVVFPVTLSALLARTDTNDLEKIATETGGQSQTVLDAMFLNEVLNNMIGRAAGSVGWGTYELVVDLGQQSVVNSIILDYTLFENTDGNWTVAASDDGFNFSDFSDQFDPNSEVEFFRLTGRYFKFKVSLLSGLSASILEEYENFASPGVPALTGINVRYSLPKISFLYLNSDSSLFGAQQIAVTIDANDPPESEIQVGVATSESSSWEDFRTGARPTVDQWGRLFIPIRTQQDEAALNEPLINLDGFVWKTEYGPWDLTSRVTIKDSDGNNVSDDDYRAYPRQGLVVFKRKRIGPFTVDIENSDKFRIGIQIINRFATEEILIGGIAYMWNSNIFLPPPLSQRPPEAQDLSIIPPNPAIYTTINATYRFFDINGEEEDTDQTEIRWYINGVEAEFLRDLRTWNDIDNVLDPVYSFGFSFSLDDVPDGTSVEQFARERGESLLSVGDIIYFTVKPSDGTNFGEVVRSPSIEVVAAPPFITTLSIQGKTQTGQLQPTVTTQTTAVASFNFFDDGGENNSTIIWYVNGVEFKRGTLNESVQGLSNNEIVPGEISSNTTALLIGNTLQVEVRPSSGNRISDPVISETITVENAPPVVSSVIITPASPAVDSGLDLSYIFFDNDIAAGNQSQQDESSIRWYRQRTNEEQFSEVADLANEGFILAVNTAAGDQWYAEVVPFDGISVGQTVRSNTVTVQDT